MRTALMAAMMLLPTGLAPARADGYVFDKGHSFVRFGWNHLGLSHQFGRVGEVEGTLTFDPDHPERSSLEVSLRMAGLATGVRELDAQLKSNEYFNIAVFPTATFKSTGVAMTGPRTGRVTGELTLVGQTHPVTLDVTWNISGEHPLAKINPVFADLYYSGFSARGVLYRSDWGLSRTIPYVSDEIELAIEAEAKRVSVDLAPIVGGEDKPPPGIDPPLPPVQAAPAPGPDSQPQGR